VSVLQRKELEDSPLADLHAIASELGIEGYRALRREKLVGAILDAQGGEEEPSDDGAAAVAVPEDTGFEPEELDEPGPEPEPELGAGPAVEEERVALVDAPADEASEPVAEEEPEGELAAGTLDILPNGSGFLRADGGGQSNDDVYVSPAQIRRCELRAGDQVSGPARPPRRSERHPSLVRVTSVNDRDAEPPEERPEFNDLVPVHPTERLPAPPALDGVPFGKGSRVAISGGPGAGATRLLRDIARSLAGTGIPVTVVLVGARPEEVTDWEREDGLAIAGGSFDRPVETQVQAAELAIERAKRSVERGGDAVVVLDSLEPLPAGAARRLFGAARNVENGGSLTVIAAVGSALEPLRQASTRITLDDAADTPTVLGPLSGTQRADLIG
jgi:transcription termination factor Rho